MNKTITDAAEIFTDKETRDAFIELWKSINCMDLYDGDLKQYIQVIHSYIMTNDRIIAKLKDKFEKTITILGD